MVHLEAIAKFISILLLEQVERVIQQLEIMLSYIAIVPLQKDNYRGQRNYWANSFANKDIPSNTVYGGSSC